MKRFLTGIAACAALSLNGAEPEIGAAPRYCNPLPIPGSDTASAAGDVTVIRDDGRYYMYCTGGGAWVSDDLLHWKFHHVDGVPIAPDVVKYEGAFYMSGNDVGLFRSDNPLGPFTKVGDWKNTPDVAGGWNEPFDMHIFIDDDGKPYLYYPGRGVSGIYVVPLDPEDLTNFAGQPTHLFGFDKDHVWERYGEMNEYPDVSWIEGPWLQKHNGVYYLEYSASGTQWKTYAGGYYTARSPTGPFTYASNNPLLRKTDGLVTGTAHGSIVEGPDGRLWQFYTIVLSNPPGGRRIGMDPVVFDKDGRISVRITDTPQWAPGVPVDPATGNDSGSLPVSINKVRAMNAASHASSEQPGRDAAYAVDNSSGTWWEPAPGDTQPSLTLDLGPATRFDVVQLFTIDSARLLFTGGFRFGARRSAPAADPGSKAHHYKIDVSTDGKTFQTVLDQSDGTTEGNTIFTEIPPTRCRFVRLTMLDWPRATPLGIIEFTVFGKSSGSLPAEEPIPVAR